MEVLLALAWLTLVVVFIFLLVRLCVDVHAVRKTSEDLLASQRATFQLLRKERQERAVRQ